MANEAVLVFEYDRPIPFIVADGNAITKGSICKMTDPMTAAITAGAADTFAGIIAGDKIASDGVTTMALYREGIFRMYASGSITVGDPVVTDTMVNYVKSARGLSNATVLSGSRVLGISLETATTGEQFLVDVHPYVIGGTA